MAVIIGLLIFAPSIPTAPEVISRYDDAGDLFCGKHTDTVNLPIVAVPIKALLSGDVDCWQLVGFWSRGSDGIEHYTQAYIADVGPFGKNCITQPNGLCASIRYDVHAKNWPHGTDLSAELLEVHEFSKMAGK